MYLRDSEALFCRISLPTRHSADTAQRILDLHIQFTHTCGAWGLCSPRRLKVMLADKQLTAQSKQLHDFRRLPAIVTSAFFTAFTLQPFSVQSWTCICHGSFKPRISPSAILTRRSRCSKSWQGTPPRSQGDGNRGRAYRHGGQAVRHHGRAVRNRGRAHQHARQGVQSRGRAHRHGGQGFQNRGRAHRHKGRGVQSRGMPQRHGFSNCGQAHRHDGHGV